MIELAFGLISVGILLVGRLIHPTHAECPRGWWLEGARPSGVFDCRRVPIGDDTWDAVHGERDRSVQPPGVLVGRVYCDDTVVIADWSGEVRCETWQQVAARHRQ